MEFSTKDWQRLGDDLAGLALKLKMHVEQTANAPAPGVRAAIDALGDAVETAFDGLRAAVTDPAIRDEVSRAAADMRDALCNTLAEVRWRQEATTRD